MLFHYSIGQYYLYSRVTDMRKGIDSLCGLVRDEMKRSPVAGSLFIFFNRRKNQLKMLHWQGDGFAIFYKRLERGTYEFPAEQEGTAEIEISAEELLFILQGVILKSVRKKARYLCTICE